MGTSLPFYSKLYHFSFNKWLTLQIWIILINSLPFPNTQKLRNSIYWHPYLREMAKIKLKRILYKCWNYSRTQLFWVLSELSEVHSSFWDYSMRNYYKDFISWENTRDYLKTKYLAPYHTLQLTQYTIHTNQYPMLIVPVLT